MQPTFSPATRAIVCPAGQPSELVAACSLVTISPAPSSTCFQQAFSASSENPLQPLGLQFWIANVGVLIIAGLVGHAAP